MEPLNSVVVARLGFSCMTAYSMGFCLGKVEMNFHAAGILHNIRVHDLNFLQSPLDTNDISTDGTVDKDLLKYLMNRNLI